jgi:hypothetical protein
MEKEDEAAEKESDQGFIPLQEGALFISTYYWALVLQQSP